MDRAGAAAHEAADKAAQDARSSRWVFVGAGGVPTPVLTYADRLTMHKEVDGTAMWTSAILPAHSIIRSWKSLAIYDCAKMRTRSIENITYRSDGDSFESRDTGAWTPVVPNTIGEATLLVACGQYDGDPIGASNTPEADAVNRISELKARHP